MTKTEKSLYRILESGGVKDAYVSIEPNGILILFGELPEHYTKKYYNINNIRFCREVAEFSCEFNMVNIRYMMSRNFTIEIDDLLMQAYRTIRFLEND